MGLLTKYKEYQARKADKQLQRIKELQQRREEMKEELLRVQKLRDEEELLDRERRRLKQLKYKNVFRWLK